VSRLSRLSAVSLAAVAAAALWPAAAWGHAAFVGSTPEPGVRLEASPRSLSLAFTEPLNRRLSTAKLIAIDGGRRVAVTVRALGARRLELVPAATLARGAYRVEWHTVSTQDGHALEGSYSFGVRASAVGGEHSVEQSPLARDGWLRVATRGALYALALVFVAALLLPLLTRRARWVVPDALVGALSVEPVRERQARLTGAVAWLTVVAAVGATLAEAADAAGGLAPGRLTDFLLGNQAGAARVLVVVFFFGAAVWWQWRPRVSAALAVLALGAVAASGHASSASPRLPSILNDWVHLASAAVWLGGIALLVAVWTPTLRRVQQPARLAVARTVLPVFGRVGLPAFALVTATGLVSLLTQLGHLDALWQTDYGRLLAIKIALVGTVAVLSASHALRLRPRLLAANPHPPERLERRHWRLMGAEPVVGLGVVAAVALLVAFPLPPRQLGEADEAEAAPSAPCDPCPLPRPAPDELAVADRAGRQLVAAWLRRDQDVLSGTVRTLDYRGRPSRVPVRVSGGTTVTCGQGCWRFRAPASAEVLRVAVRDAGRRYVVALPALWDVDANQRARRLLGRVQETMRGLRSVREFEEVTSGPGSYAATTYWLQAPDRMRYRTNGGAESVIIGLRQWLKAPGSGWQLGQYGSGLAFRTRSWFRWTSYGRAVRLLEVRRAAGERRLAELALMDEGTPVWFRLTIDLATNRVLSERMAAEAHFMHSRYVDLNRSVRVKAPRGSDG
jgi:copper transport protein